MSKTRAPATAATPGESGALVQTSTAERTWFVAASSAIGPYNPIEKTESITFYGSRSDAARTHGLDTSSVPNDGTGISFDLVDSKGSCWSVRMHCGRIAAFRDRTEAEMVEYIDRCSAATYLDVQKYRILACRRISLDLVGLAESMNPDRCPSRNDRRRLKRRMRALALLQWELLSGYPKSPAEVRASMVELGVPHG